ncbi:hypothetical protein VOLCADRAFT_92598 [Volvox carteri f. nagariensis]|uniref:C2 domain-containing protein n=1 Tax=Volvox carteri f. nagariensis TaxID=3068 RepID=D8U025_VOLCA|nr:uncharacterized protein VOLCADRAFT_92598 [Volvox carteri f. nagariensis]EFJ46863.1 hypothetical protein VOLCADRAFT_92598 [Volvox carteri f. nagariensis]|eukprot:XP_002952072.1 hypothetical protein VOLCADRAFT_92598 [Volvox carteri f. nagariensis]
MRNSLDAPPESPRASIKPVKPGGGHGSGRKGLLAAFSDTLKRAWRPARTCPHYRPYCSPVPRDTCNVHLLEMPPRRRTVSLVPRPASGPLEGSASRGWDPAGRGHSHSPGSSRKHVGRPHHAVPVSTTRVQDVVRWVNLVRLVNVVKLLRPYRLLPRSRRRVRFGPAAGQRGLMMTSGGGEGGKPIGDLAAGATGAVQGSPAAASRPVYIQVRQGRHLVWPSFEGMDYSCSCLLLVGGQLRGSTQAAPVAQGGGGAGGGGGVAWGGGNSNTVQWNEVFSLPRSCLEGAPGGRVVLEVWCSEPDDVLVGQAELLLGPMLEVENPHPLSTVLELQAIDEETGQVEPGTCGELHVAAWVEPEVVDRAAQCPYSLPTVAPADLGEAGVVTSNLSAPCGSKSMPQVVHSPLGTLYEEPCVVALKLSVVGLVDLSYDTLLQGASQGGTSKKRVRLEAYRVSSNVRDPRDARGGDRERSRGLQTAAKAALPSAGSAPVPSVPFASPSVTRGMGPFLERLRRRRQQQNVRAQLQTPPFEPPDDKSGGGAGGPATAASGGGAAAGRFYLPLGWLPRILSGSLHHVRQRLGGGGGRTVAAPAPSGSMDDLLEEEEDTAGPGAAGGGGGGGAAAASSAEDKTLSADDADDGSSLMLNPTLPLSGMTAEEPSTGVGQVQGQGVFCYFKQLQHLAEAAASVALQPSVFVFTLTRPLNNVPVGLAMYVTTSVSMCGRRGRVVGRLTVRLYDLLDQVLGAATAGGLPASQRPDMGVTGKRVEVSHEFEEVELGGVRLVVQLADLDKRAMVFRLPVVSDPQQLVAEGALGSGGGACSLLAASMLPGGDTDPAGKGWSAGEGGGGGGKRAHTHTLGPVLSDTDLLQKVLRRTGLHPRPSSALTSASVTGSPSRTTGYKAACSLYNTTAECCSIITAFHHATKLTDDLAAEQQAQFGAELCLLEAITANTRRRAAATGSSCHICCQRSHSWAACCARATAAGSSCAAGVVIDTRRDRKKSIERSEPRRGGLPDAGRAVDGDRPPNFCPSCCIFAMNAKLLLAEAVLSFQDVVASCLFTAFCVLLMVVVALLGFPSTMFLVLLWQLLHEAAVQVRGRVWMSLWGSTLWLTKTVVEDVMPGAYPPAVVDVLLHQLSTPYEEPLLNEDCPYNIRRHWYETFPARERHHRHKLQLQLSAILQRVQPRTQVVGFMPDATASTQRASAGAVASLSGTNATAMGAPPATAGPKGPRSVRRPPPGAVLGRGGLSAALGTVRFVLLL